MATTNLGRVMPVDKGAYNAGTTYARLDMVHTSDSTYVSKQDGNVGHAVTDTNWWTCYADGKPVTEAVAQFEANEGTAAGSTAGDGSRWGAYKAAEAARGTAAEAAEGTSESAAGSSNRWGQYKSAEAQRNAARETAEGSVSSQAGDGTRWGAYKRAEALRNVAAGEAEGTKSGSSAGDGSRWGDYKSAEQNRDSEYNFAESGRDSDYAAAEGSAAGSSAGDGTRWGAYKAAEAARQEEMDHKANIEDLENGTLVPALAENLESWAEEEGLEVQNEWSDTIRTTAGDDPIVTDSGGTLIGVRAVSDFKCTDLKTTPYNQLRLASAGGLAVAIGSGWYFPVPKLTFGAYGSATENNGIVFTDNNHNDITGLTVRFKPLASGVPNSDYDGTQLVAKASAAAANQDGGIWTDHNVKFYLTPGPGYLIVTGITYANTCAHFGWEDWYDKFVSPTDAEDVGDSINLAPLFTAVPNGTGKFLVCGNAATEAVHTDATHMLITDPIARITSPSWTNTAVEGGYKHELSIPAMKPGSFVMIEGSSQPLAVDGTIVSYTDENAAAIAGVVRYELLTPATATATLAKTSYALNDCGIEMKVGAEGTAMFTCAYSQNVADALSQIAKIRVQDIAEDVEALNEEVGRQNYQVPCEAAFDAMPTLGGQPGLLFCNGAPTASNKPTNWTDFLDGGYNWTGLPNIEGQHVLDYINHINYYGWRNPSTGLLEWKY